MKPVLNSVIATEINDDSTKVELTYMGSELLAGIDLHGVDAGLSWLKDKGLALLKHESEERMLEYTITIMVSDSCEFRARSYIVDEDYWEAHNNKLTRNEDGSIIFETDNQNQEDIKLVNAPPNPFSPHIDSIILIEVQEQSSIIEIVYSTTKDVDGIELQGVDAGLSWLKNESLQMQQIDGNRRSFTITLEITDRVEFRARAFNERGDHWEEGENHKILRRKDGTITLLDDYELDEDFEFVWILPLDLNPTTESIIKRLSLEGEVPPSLFQYLIDTSIWYTEYIKDPYNQNLFDLISGMMRYIREKQREIASLTIDRFVNPIVKSLYQIYTTAISFTDEDIDSLTHSWHETGITRIFKEIPDRVNQLSTVSLNSVDDREKRERELWEYN